MQIAGLIGKGCRLWRLNTDCHCDDDHSTQVFLRRADSI